MLRTQDTMTQLFVGHAWLTYHAGQLAREGHPIAADQLAREAARLGEVLDQIDGVISDFTEAAPAAKAVSA